jgi:hypothetical protein
MGRVAKLTFDDSSSSAKVEALFEREPFAVANLGELSHGAEQGV